ncbi:MAG TPA: hypothetical protein VHP11_02125, partial [Tepidisphaeraceae bacterium]|nr:hypothetical protein [Tepidisphaeraceae bacterium]
VKHQLSIRGTERRRATQRDDHGVEIASFDEMIWDTEKSQVISKSLRATGRSGTRLGGSSGSQGLLK